MEHNSWSSLLGSSDPDFRIVVGHTIDIPAPTAEDPAREKHPDAHDRRELANVWKEEGEQFKKLKRLSYALGVKRVIVAPETVIPDHLGFYIYDGAEMNTELRREWGLSCTQARSLDGIMRRCEPIILISRYACFEQGACHTLAHEIGHHIFECLAGLPEREKKLPVSKLMCHLFPADTYVHENRSEICAECFAEYFTNSELRRGIERICASIVRRVRRHNPNAAKLIESHRQASS